MPKVFLECLNRVLRDAQCRAWLRQLVDQHELPVISMNGNTRSQRQQHGRPSHARQSTEPTIK
jgi:hypothetical protein